MPLHPRESGLGLRACGASERGVALMLTLFAIAAAVILSCGFLAAQSTTSGIARNVDGRNEARAIAESVLNLTTRYMQSDATWRTTKPHGTWLTDIPLLGGTFSLSCEDGVYDPATETVDGDGDLTDSASEKVTVTVTSTYQGASYLLRAVVTPPAVVDSPKVLMIVANSASLTDAETSRKELIESWNWEVTTLTGGASGEQYTAALAEVHVVYVPDDGGSETVASRLAGVATGVVFEDGDLFSPMGLATQQTSFSGNVIRIVDRTHYITSPFSIGDLTVATTPRVVEAPFGSIAGGLRPLARWPDTDQRVLATIDMGQTLTSGLPSPGRRAALPLTGFTADELNDSGKSILRRSLEWAAQAAMGTDSVTALGNWTTSSTITLTAGEDRLLVVTVGAETHATISSITFGNQPMTLVTSAYESTGVGARSFIYMIGETGIAAASDRVLRATWTSGSRDNASFASRLYSKVNQANPIRTTARATNAGPPTISCEAMSVSSGDMAISAVRVGHENRSYTWTSPMVEGIEDKLSTSTHTSADYPVASGVSSVVAAATCNAPNRQAMVAAVIQPRTRSNGEGIIPTTLALYEFDEQQPTATLVGHWPLDDDGSGGAVAIGGNVSLSTTARIDGYYGANGTYGGGNSGKDVTLVTNTSSGNGISVSGSAVIQGTTYNRPGANPTNVVSISGSGSITGSRFEQSVQFTLPTNVAPTGMPATSGNRTINSGATTISSDVTYTTLTINTGAVVTINGDVRIQLTDDLVMSGTAQIVVPSGSRLRLYVNDDVTLSSSAKINDVSNAATRFELFQYGGNADLNVSGTATISGILKVARNVAMSSSAIIHGAVYIGGSLTMQNDARLRIDLSRPGFGIIPVADGTATNGAQAHDAVSFQQAGARAFTDKSLRFDGVKNFVRIGHNDAYLISHGTVSFWFNSESLSGTRAIFSKDSSGYDTGGHLHIYTEGTTLKAKIQSDGLSPFGTGNDFTASTGGLSTNTWYHVTVTFGAGGLRLYTDGTLRQTVSYPGGMGPNSGGLGNFQPIVLGAGTATAGDLTHLPVNEYFVGRIDDVRIYDAVLDAAQISRLNQGQDIGARTEPSYLVAETGGMGQPLNLYIDNTQSVSWPSGGGLILTQPTVIRSASLPDKIRNGTIATGELTIEIVSNCTDPSSNGRLLWYGAATGTDANVDIYQDSARHHARLRTSDTSSSPTAVSSSTGAATNTRHHLLLTYRNGTLRIYRDGATVADEVVTGSLLTWNPAYGLTLGGLPDGTSTWLGKIERVTIYDRAMNPRQADNLFNDLPPGDGATSSGGFQVRWIENP